MSHRNFGTEISGIDRSMPAPAVGDFVILTGETFDAVCLHPLAAHELIGI